MYTNGRMKPFHQTTNSHPSDKTTKHQPPKNKQYLLQTYHSGKWWQSTFVPSFNACHSRSHQLHMNLGKTQSAPDMQLLKGTGGVREFSPSQMRLGGRSFPQTVSLKCLWSGLWTASEVHLPAPATDVTWALSSVYALTIFDNRNTSLTFERWTAIWAQRVNIMHQAWRDQTWIRLSTLLSTLWNLGRERVNVFL